MKISPVLCGYLIQFVVVMHSGFKNYPYAPTLPKEAHKEGNNESKRNFSLIQFLNFTFNALRKHRGRIEIILSGPERTQELKIPSHCNLAFVVWKNK